MIDSGLRDTRQEDVEKPFDSSTRRVTYPESYITKYTTYTKNKMTGQATGGVVRGQSIADVESKTCNQRWTCNESCERVIIDVGSWLTEVVYSNVLPASSPAQIRHRVFS